MSVTAGRTAGRAAGVSRRESGDSVRAPAVRLSRARLRDVRLWSGLALLALSVAAGALLLGRSEDTVTVWRATRDLSVGSTVTPGGDGLEPVLVAAAIARDRYAGPAQEASGRLRWPITAGELVPISALAAPMTNATRLVTLPLDPRHAPVGLAAGDLVDAWAVPSPDDGVAAAPRLLLAGASVVEVSVDTGLTGDVAAVLDVPEAAAASVVAAAHAGVIDLVAVPPQSQEPAP